MARERTGAVRTVASGVVAGGAGGAGGYAILTALGVPEQAAIAMAGILAGLMLAVASWARDKRQMAEPGSSRDLFYRLLATLGCCVLVLELQGCAVGIQAGDWQTGIAVGKGAVGDCSEYVYERPSSEAEPLVTSRSEAGWCIRGAEASDQAADAGGNIFSSLLGLLGLL